MEINIQFIYVTSLIGLQVKLQLNNGVILHSNDYFQAAGCDQTWEGKIQNCYLNVDFATLYF
uniref:Uncharacterized protein n=1 Tax=Lepeophtheirus salmonis TaxID=72036 RepID=A0A0K2TBN0_LEPSM